MQTDELFSELYELSEELLTSDHNIKLRVGGWSMYPFSRNGDIIVFNKCKSSELKIGDIVIFKTEKKWIAHRLIKIVTKDAHTIYITKGDACKHKDPPFSEEKLLGKATSYSHNGKVKNLESLFYKTVGKLMVQFSWLFTPIITTLLLLKKIRSKGFKILSGVWKSLLFISRRSRKKTFFNLILAVFQGLLPFVIIYLFKWVIDDLWQIDHFTRANLVADKSQAFDKLIMLIIASGLVFLANSLITIINTESRERLSQSISLYIYDLLHKKHITLDMSCLEDSGQQNKIHRAVQEAGFRPLKMVTESLAILTSGVSCVFVFAMLLTVHWSVALLILVAVLPGFFVRFKFAAKLYQLNRSNSTKEREAYYYNRIITGLPFAKELRLFKLGNLFKTRFNNVQVYLHNRKNSLMRKKVIADILAQVFAVSLIFFSFGLVSWFAVKGSITIGTVVLFFLVFQRGFSVLKDLFNSVAGICEDNVFLQDFFDFLEMPSTNNVTDQAQNVRTLHKGISIEDVSFHYPSSQRKALENISLEIPAGKTVALVGANGSGKTTLVKLLCSFYKPDSGTILFDGANISETDPDEIRSQITAVFQDFALFNMSASENIWLGNSDGDINLNEIKKSAQNAGIADVLENLPDGYNNMLGNLFDKGEELSIGQWQKIAIARAFYRNSPILFMDEPSSALDAETELHLLQNLKMLAKNKTVLIISHRFSTIKWADMIYVLDKGKIIEKGNHEQLMQMKGKYSSMFEQSRAL